MQQVTRVEIVIDRGCDFYSDTYVWTDGDGGELGGDGNPLSLATSTAIARFRINGVVVLTLTDTNGITLDRTTSGDTMGEYSFALTEDQASSLNARGRCDFDLLIKDSVSGIQLKAIYATPVVRSTASLSN